MREPTPRKTKYVSNGSNGRAMSQAAAAKAKKANPKPSPGRTRPDKEKTYTARSQESVRGANAANVKGKRPTKPNTSVPAKNTGGGQKGYQQKALDRTMSEAMDRAPKYPPPVSRGANGWITKSGKKSTFGVVVGPARSESRNSRASAARLTAQSSAAAKKAVAARRGATAAGSRYAAQAAAAKRRAPKKGR